MTQDLVAISREGSIVTLTLNAPPMNLISLEMTRQLRSALDELAEDTKVRVLLVTGAGEKAFCAGSDIKEFDEFGRSGDAWQYKKLEPENDMYDRLATFPTPTIAVAAGHALGGGLELAVCCDVIVASESARFGLPEVALGVFPGSGGTFRVPRRIGMARTAELVFLGELIDAATALEWGLINRVVPRRQLLETAGELAEKIAGRSPVGTMFAKQAIAEAFAPTGAAARDTYLPRNRAAFEADDVVEGTRAFFAKDVPRFQDRT